MPKEERRRSILDFLIERESIFPRPARKRVLKGARSGVEGILTMDLKPVIAESLAKFLATPFQEGLKQGLGSTIGTKEEKLRGK